MKKDLLPISDTSGSLELLFSSNESGENEFLNVLPAAIFVCDAEGRIITHNQKAVDLWRRKPEPKEAIGAFFEDLEIFSKEDRKNRKKPAITEPVEKLKAWKAEELTVENLGRHLLTVKVNTLPLKDEQQKVVGHLYCFYDITEEKTAQKDLQETKRKYNELVNLLEKKVEDKTADLKLKNEELKKSEERYHKMVDEVEDYAILLLDKNGIIQNWNKGAEKIKGYKEQEIVGKSFEVFYREEDRKIKLPLKLITRARDEGKAVHEGWRVRNDGTRFWGSVVLTALHDSNGEIIGFTKVTRDLTKKKLAEDRIKAYTQQLEFQNKELEQFAYAASHDMKEPLRKVHFYNSYIADSLAGKIDEKTADYLNRSVNAVKRMSELIDDLLTYSRTTSDEQRFDVVNLNEVVDEILLGNKETFDGKNVKVKVGKLHTLPAIPFQIRQLMDNIIGNAVKYRHPKRKLQVSIQSEQIKGSHIGMKGVEPDMDYCHISVEDNGLGFNEHYADKIFEIFQRLDNGTGAKGSGIGLALCKKIVQNHHGFITAHGQENEGAHFDIYLPMQSIPVAPSLQE